MSDSTPFRARRRTGAGVLMLAAFVLALAACSGSPTRSSTGQDPHAALQQRVEAYWQHLIAREYDQAYTYLTPGYRSTYSEQDFIRRARRNPIGWKNMTWQDVDCATADSCLVNMLVTYTVRAPGAGSVDTMGPIDERWLRINRQWYLLPGQD